VVEISSDVITKFLSFAQNLDSKEKMQIFLGLCSPAAAGAYFLYKHGKSFGEETARTQTAEISLLKTTITNLQNDIDRIKPGYERANQQTIEKTQEILTLRSALSSSSHGGENKALVEQLQQRVDKFDSLKNALLGAEDEVWKLRNAEPPSNFEARMLASRLKVITVGNLKGGVGKTTVTANLATYFASVRKKRVLVIDFDYQGSLTRMMVLGAQLPLGTGILADTLLEGDVKPVWLTQASRELGSRIPNTRIISCGPPFDGFENRALLRWLIGEINEDVRFRLSKLLLSDEVQNAFDLVIIDAPPRLSLGTVNALCASHALIIPTVPDALSVDATNRFLQRANIFRPLNPALRHVGVVTSMSAETTLKNYEIAAMQDVKQGLSQWNGSPGRVFNRNIRHFASLSRAAGRNLGYIEDAAVRGVFNELGEEVSAAWQL
jgi:cellulose biosynthesis protein BcsQ